MAKKRGEGRQRQGIRRNRGCNRDGRIGVKIKRNKTRKERDREKWRWLTRRKGCKGLTERGKRGN